MVEQLTQHDPRRIGPFEVLGRLGAGGMGLVYLARSASGRRVAIKTVRAELAEDQLFRVRFTREVEAARAVSGFYTAAVVDADPRAAVPWLATAYVPAPSLEEIVNESGPLPAEAVRWLAAGIAEALQSIHAAGLVHRDLKPSNVLVVEDGPRVIDFGIAAGVSNTRLTMTNVAVGTPAYMSPEQARDTRSVSGASDVFSLGSTLVFAATGHAPYHGANPVETVFMLLREGPDLAGLPDELRPLIESCMRMEAEQRPTPADLQAQLAPHLFSSGGDDTGTASAWLPPGAVAHDRGAHRGPSGGARRPAVAAAPSRRNRAGLRARSGPAAQAPPRCHRHPSHGPVRSRRRDGSAPQHAAAAVTRTARRVRADRPRAAGRAGRRRTRRRPACAPAPSGSAGRTAGGAHRAPDRSRRRPCPRRRTVESAGGVAALALPDVERRVGHPGGRRRPALRHLLRGARARCGQRTPPVQDPGRGLDDGGGRRADPRLRRPQPVRARRGRRRRAVAYRRSTAGCTRCRPIAGTVVTGTRGGGVQAWDAARGTLRWERTGAQTEFESPDSGPAVDGRVVYYQGGGLLHAVDALTGTEMWSYPVGEPGAAGSVVTRPVVADGVVHLTAGTRVLALDARTGAERWHFEAPAVMFAPPAHVPGPGASGGGIYVTDHLGTVYALDPADGRDRWRVATEPRQSLEPVVVAAGGVHLGAGSALYTLDAVSGTPRWRFAAQDEIVGSPAVADGRVHFGSKDHCLYTVDAQGGQLRWRLETGGEITGSPVAADGVVYACSKDRCVYALDAAKGTGSTARRA